MVLRAAALSEVAGEGVRFVLIGNVGSLVVFDGRDDRFGLPSTAHALDAPPDLSQFRLLVDRIAVVLPVFSFSIFDNSLSDGFLSRIFDVIHEVSGFFPFSSAPFSCL